MNQPRSDFTPPVDLLATPGTGPVRARRPVYVDLQAPCNHACPAGENVQGWLALARAGREQDAWRALLADNPLPAVHGRVCYHPCERACNRTQLDSAVAIHAVERFLADQAALEHWPAAAPAAPSGRRVLVVGSGPAGLSCAYHLARLGHTVEVHEAEAHAGGMLRFGIPAYRLPRAVLDEEIARIEALGVTFRFNRKIDDVRSAQQTGRFDAVFLGIGAGVATHLELPARDAARVVDAVTLLHGIGAGERPSLGRRVIVYGGGNTALDAARSARRLGADDTLIVYRRDRAHMPAHASEFDQAIAEGIQFRWLTTIRAAVGPDLLVEQMTLDADGRPQPTGQVEQLSADALVLALGQQTDSAVLHRLEGVEFTPDGGVRVDATLMTGCPGVFAGGDMVSGDRTVTVSVGHGKRAARHIDAFLRTRTVRESPAARLADFPGLHLPFYSDAERREAPLLPVAARTTGFAEIAASLSAEQARYEAQRCLSCGNCFECDQCYAACPQQAIEKLAPAHGYRIEYARCTGCAVCFETCPCHALEMTDEPAQA